MLKRYKKIFENWRDEEGVQEVFPTRQARLEVQTFLGITEEEVDALFETMLFRGEIPIYQNQIEKNINKFIETTPDIDPELKSKLEDPEIILDIYNILKKYKLALPIYSRDAHKVGYIGYEKDPIRQARLYRYDVD